MRMLTAVLPAVSAILLLALTGFSQTSAIPIVIGCSVVLLAYLNSKRYIGMIGFFVASIGAVIYGGVNDLTVVTELESAGGLLILPCSMLLWCALSSSGAGKEAPKVGALPYIVAIIFAAGVLISIPIAGNLFPSMMLSGDTGVGTSVMVLAFSTAILAVAILGRTRD